MIPDSAMTAEQWSQMPGVENVPRLRFGWIGKPLKGEAARVYGLAVAASGAKQLFLDPFEVIQPASARYLTKMKQLELIWIEAHSYCKVGLPENFFGALGCRETLKRVGMQPTSVLGDTKSLKDFPNLDKVQVGKLSFTRDKLDELIALEKEMEESRDSSEGQGPVLSGSDP